MSDTPGPRIKVTFLIVTLRTFGSVRELVETANRLSHYGCDVTIATPTGEKCGWLPVHCRVVPYSKARDADVLVMMTAPDNDAMRTWDRLEAGRRLFVSMGFDPDTMGADGPAGPVKTDRNMRRLITESRAGDVEICADASWQLRHFESLGCRVGVSLGGVNVHVFNTHAARPTHQRGIRYGVSGDPRPRKANHVAQQAIRAAGGEPTPYWGRTDQEALVTFLRDTRVFVDSHVRAGWCNPALEAMACGAAVVCSDIPAVRDFAHHGRTALLCEPGDVDGFARAVRKLDSSPALASALAAEGAREAGRWSYDRMAQAFYHYLTEPVALAA